MGVLKDHAGGKYLRSTDLENTGKEFGLVLTILDFTEANVAREDDQPEMRPILHFKEGGYKPMVLNKTNLNFILGHYGDKESLIVGKKILVWVNPDVEYAGKTVMGLRLAAPQMAVDSSHADADKAEPDDDIPF